MHRCWIFITLLWFVTITTSLPANGQENPGLSRMASFRGSLKQKFSNIRDINVCDNNKFSAGILMFIGKPRQYIFATCQAIPNKLQKPPPQQGNKSGQNGSKSGLDSQLQEGSGTQKSNTGPFPIPPRYFESRIAMDSCLGWDESTGEFTWTSQGFGVVNGGCTNCQVAVVDGTVSFECDCKGRKKASIVLNGKMKVGKGGLLRCHSAKTSKEHKTID